MFFKKLKRYLKVKDVDVSIYYLTSNDEIINLPEIGYKIESEIVSNSTKKYFINLNEQFVHHSFLYKKKRILTVINKKGPIIGDCITALDFRGKSIYPYVLNYIAKEVLNTTKTKEIFVLVANKNKISIKGVERSGFKIHSKVKAKRFLFFYYNIVRE